MNDHTKCLGWHPSLFGPKDTVNCIHGEDGTFKLANTHKVTLKECETCPHFKSRYIEYPITVDNIDVAKLEPWFPGNRKAGLPAAVRIAGETQTYLGLYLGELPWILTVGYEEDNRTLRVGSASNPCLLIPSLGRLVWGAECWWHLLDSPDDFKEITDKTISSQWYVQAAKALYDKKEGTDS